MKSSHTQSQEFILEHPEIDFGMYIDLYKRFLKEDYQSADEKFFDYLRPILGIDKGVYRQYWEIDPFCSRESKNGELYAEAHIYASSLLDTIKKLINNNKQKKKLLTKRLKVVFARNKTVLFGTFTFDRNNTLGGNHNLDQMTDEDLLKIVEDYLKSKSILDYVINYDYHQSGEVHFHVIFGCEYLNENEFSKELKIGFANVRKVRGVYSKVNKKPLTSYFCKLTNHCIKASTQNKKIRYSKSLRGIKLYGEDKDENGNILPSYIVKNTLVLETVF